MFIPNLSRQENDGTVKYMSQLDFIGRREWDRTTDHHHVKIARQVSYVIDETGKRSFFQTSIKRKFTWSARARLRAVPGNPGRPARLTELLAIQARCVQSRGGCWVYPKVRDGAYPYIDLRPEGQPCEQWSARRYAWALANGDIPENGIIMGNCPLKACVNPEHQWLWVPPKQFDWVAA